MADSRTSEQWLWLENMAALVTKLYNHPTDQLAFHKFIIEHGYNMSADQTSKLMWVMADYVDKSFEAHRQERAAQLGSIPQSPPSHIMLANTSSEIQPEPQSTPTGDIEVTESQSTDVPTQQPPKPFRPEPGHRSTVLALPSTPEDDGVSDELVEYVRKNYVQKYHFPDVQRVEIGHLFELMNWYIGFQTRPDGPTPYKITYLYNQQEPQVQ